jgi:hypothetical protein
MLLGMASGFVMFECCHIFCFLFCFVFFFFFLCNFVI